MFASRFLGFQAVLLMVLETTHAINPDSFKFFSQKGQEENLPFVKLPYATYQASNYDAVHDVYVWRNIRYAAPPVGNLRFAKPAPPSIETKVQDKNRKGASCGQIISAKGGAELLTTNLPSGMGQIISSLINETDFAVVTGGDPISEDCLFLDVMVPGKAFRKEVKLPIINWLHGGSYKMGNKGAMFDGLPIIKAASGNVIYVVSNYRLGPFGFLSGMTAEKDKSVTTNAGLYDQRAVFQWIQNYIELFGGNPQEVTAWGESAGAASIVHHLTAFGGKQDPLFSKAVLLSPSFMPSFDRKNKLEKNLQDFADLVACKDKGVECLRNVDFKKLLNASISYQESLPEGMLAFAPSADGQYVRQLPPLEFATGNFYSKGIKSLIVSHVSDEAKIFISQNQSAEIFRTYQDLFYSNNSIITDAVVKRFPLPSPGSKYESHYDRFSAMIQFSSFNCHPRWISEAYRGKTWDVRYSLGAGVHGSDLAATFFGSEDAKQWSLVGSLGGGEGDKSWNGTASLYQSYLLSHARTGDPNTLKASSAIEWPKVNIGPVLSNVLSVATPLSLISDPDNSAEDCDFWLDVFSAATNMGGYAPVGASRHSRLVQNDLNASANFILS